MARTTKEALGDAERVSARLIADTREFSLRWEWDSRFSSALSVVKAPQDRPVLALVGGLFAGAWDHENIGGAPDPVRAIAAAWGLNAGQRLFTLDPANDPLLFAAWWPWGSGTTASLRIGCMAHDPTTGGPTDLRRWFSL